MKRVFRLLGALALMALLALAAAGFVGSILAKNNSGVQTPFLFDIYAENSFFSLGGGLLVVSDVELHGFDAKGAPLMTLARSYPEALVATNGPAAVVWSQGGSGACILNANGSQKDLSFNGTLLSADVNAGGWQAYLTAETGYRGAVTVYDPEGAAVYRVYIGGSYPLDADVSSEAARVALLSLTGQGSRVAVYRLDQETEQAFWEAETLYFELEYLSDSRMLLLSTDSAVFLDEDCQAAGSFTFPDEYIKDYSAAGRGFVVLALGRYRAGSAGRLVTLDYEGKELASLEIDQEIESLSVAGEHIAVLYRDRAVLYDPQLTETGSLENTAGIQAALAREDGSAVIVSGAAAAIYEP